MILRRVIAHVRKQEWTAIGIDFVIVVFGVFIGIQVANWNEARLEAQRAHGFLERLSDDLEKEQASIDQRLAYIGQSIAFGEAALTWAEDGTLVEGSAWKTVMAFFNASRILPYSPIDETAASGILRRYVDAPELTVELKGRIDGKLGDSPQKNAR